MNSEEIIDMAIQAGASPDENKIWLMYAEEIEAFANLVAAKEREACAKVCDDEWNGDADTYEYSIAANDCAAAIRARGEQA
jgi:hypothetical protein